MMPTLTLHPAEGCVVCGCRIRGIHVGTYRINARSLRGADRGALVATDRRCAECGHPTPPVTRWKLDAKSQAVVDTYRLKKGWTERGDA